VPQIINWLWGIEPIPNDVFLRAVDVVLNATAEEIRHSREALHRIRAEKARPKR
jgi:hypothetical protein